MKNYEIVEGSPRVGDLYFIDGRAIEQVVAVKGDMIELNDLGDRPAATRWVKLGTQAGHFERRVPEEPEVYVPPPDACVARAAAMAKERAAKEE